jgi:hypothetical protein
LLALKAISEADTKLKAKRRARFLFISHYFAHAPSFSDFLGVFLCLSVLCLTVSVRFVRALKTYVMENPFQVSLKVQIVLDFIVLLSKLENS